MAPKIRLLKRIAWGTFAATGLALALAPGILPMWSQWLAFGASLLALLGLLLLYNHALASWRAVLCSWLAYAAFRVLTVRLAGTGSFLETNLAPLAMLLSVEAMFTALGAILALGIRRDVSVAYVALSFGLGAWLMLWMVRSAGGVLKLLTDSMVRDAASVFSISEPVIISLSCMATLGFLTFFPHLLWMLIREARGR